MFTATINTPGYLPDSAESSPVFDTAREAWEYLADEIHDAWEAHDDFHGSFKAHHEAMKAFSSAWEFALTADMPGSVTVDNRAYNVEAVETVTCWDRIGATYPSYMPRIAMEPEYYFNAATGMEYRVYNMVDRIIVDAAHIDVGVTTWWEWHGTESALIAEITE